MTVIINDEITINRSNYLLSMKTLLEEVITYYRNNGDYTVKTVFNRTYLTELAGLDNFYSSYTEMLKTKANLEHLIGFDIQIPFDFKQDCNPILTVNILIRSQHCSDTKIKQNKLVDFLRFTLLHKDFLWQGQVATDLTATNDQNSNPRNYRITGFAEANQRAWYQTQLEENSNFVTSQLSFNFKIYNQ